MEQIQTLSLPEESVVSADTSVAVNLPQNVPEAAYSLLVTIKPLAVGSSNFVMQACPEATCEAAPEQALAIMSFFPPPIVGEERQFVIQVPAAASAAHSQDKLVLSLVPLVEGGAKATELQITSVEVMQ
ncbi:hypothetical protein [Devosia aquimaris]|uniref:hypothetical protein n=1 Tax=Devosia aquimaris TaxID=2866214 RepID=UPI001CD11A23|nr:hypothetical protein [Devosia sp. CJK-A8-3]